MSLRVRMYHPTLFPKQSQIAAISPFPIREIASQKPLAMTERWMSEGNYSFTNPKAVRWFYRSTNNCIEGTRLM